MQHIRFLSYRPLAALAAAAFLSACAASTPTTYTGTLAPLAGTCDVLNRATLQRHAETVQFTPQDGVMVLEGTITPSGDISATEQTTGMDRKPYRLVFTGRVQGQAITGTYVSPRCRYTVSLQATPN